MGVLPLDSTISLLQTRELICYEADSDESTEQLVISTSGT